MTFNEVSYDKYHFRRGKYFMMYFIPEKLFAFFTNDLTDHKKTELPEHIILQEELKNVNFRIP